jgi:hypothetical protein
MSTPLAADAKLIGFYCPVCGYLPDPVPICAGSKARTGKEHEPTRMKTLSHQ